ncbi:alpha/beta hydrolase [Leptospira stimsonii]|uniref:Alpha/beta hydrolase n=1 Tax=Leptospira stimsonii TaxID=2202203 RepID=A0A8B3D0P4_9LEPT|nr:alpha/beta hydrolase [Leptospira stimsonii]RHX88523.1 alpha/beta hydrolase [Leptospira stimsonii]
MRIEFDKTKVRTGFRRVRVIFGLLLALVATQSLSADFERKTLTYQLMGHPLFSSLTTQYLLNVVHYRKIGGPINPTPKGVFCIHGFGDNSALFEPLAKELINQGKADNVYIVDLPGHASSSIVRGRGTATTPSNYSELSMGNYTDAMTALLSQMTQTEGKKIQTIVGHSLGGLVIQMIQDRTRKLKSSLYASFGIDNTILIASDIPSPLPWYGGDAPMSDPYSAKALVWNFKEDRIVFADDHPPVVEWGRLIVSPNDFYINSKFAVNGVPVAGAPAGVQLTLMSSPEPYPAGANIVGLDPTGNTTTAVPRLSVAQNLWNGFNLKVVWLDKDPFFSQSETQGLAQYLKAGLNAITISDPEAVHGTPYSKPSLLIPLF